MTDPIRPDDTKRRRGFPIRMVGGIVAALALGVGGTYSALTAITDDGPNVVQSGNLAIIDNDGGSVMFNVNNVSSTTPNSVACIKVTNSGTIPYGALHIYADGKTGSSLETDVTMTIERGTGVTDPFPGCTAFTIDPVGGSVFSGSISSIPATYTAGVADNIAAWTPGGARFYRFTLNYSGLANADMGKTAQFIVHWEAHD